MHLLRHLYVQSGRCKTSRNAPNIKHVLRKRKLLSLALQGGGALGALTWGVLDRLLEEPRLRIEAISGPAPAP